MGNPSIRFCVFCWFGVHLALGKKHFHSQVMQKNPNPSNFGRTFFSVQPFSACLGLGFEFTANPKIEHKWEEGLV